MNDRTPRRRSLSAHALVAAAAIAASCSAPSSAPATATCAVSPPAVDTACAPHDVLVAAGDYASSAVGGFSLDGTSKLLAGVDLGKDPTLAVSAGRSFFVARDQDAVFELDGRCGLPRTKLSVHAATGTGTGSSNPQDVAVAADGSLWIPRYNVPELAIVPPCGGAPRTISLAAYDDDGNPNASAIRIVDVAGTPKAFIALERLDDRDRLLSKQPSSILRVDVSTGSVEAQVELVGRNPFGLMAHAGGALYLAEPGNFDATNEPLAGVERFDTATSTSKLVVTEAALGGSVAIVAVAAGQGDAGCAAAIVADATPGKNRTAVVTFDPSTGRVFTSFASPAYGPTDNYDLLALAWHGDALLVGDRRATSRGYAVHVFDRAGACDLTPRPDTIFLELPPLVFGAAE